ncbi:hypothetical protein FZEAL_10474 [Fusarium zealandicum]|uniref:Uncharacterized protein n=1 Tax=Fusarium zealandicum TaxID=1053134 RepID=A0A8H4XAD8_9HYPO|nr:hypothetical protein FZEAL_10474 [Fusarium zealandicum]
MATETTTFVRSDPANSMKSPISPPNSPPTSCHQFQTLRPQSIDMLAFQLGEYSLEQYHYDSNLGISQPTVALSPASLPDDDFANGRSSPSQHGSASMDIDVEHGTMFPENGIYLESQGASVSSSNRVLTPSTGCSSRVHASPIAADPTVLEAQSHISHTMYGPTFDSLPSNLDFDEGYCEEEDDFAWLEAAVSLRSAGTPGGIKKRYGLRYRTSAEAASLCSNAIHSMPRMRRRDKKKRKQPKLPDDSVAEGSGSSVSKAVAST